MFMVIQVLKKILMKEISNFKEALIMTLEAARCDEVVKGTNRSSGKELIKSIAHRKIPWSC